MTSHFLGRAPGRDLWLLFSTRCARMFAFGALSVLLVLYLKAEGLREGRIGLLLSLTLLGDTALSLFLALRADHLGRRSMLCLGAVLMGLGGMSLLIVDNYALLLVMATVCVLSPSDKEVGPFLSIEQAALSEVVSDQTRTPVFAWYHLAGSLAAACGALAAGFITTWMEHKGATGADTYRPIIVGYSVTGLLIALLFTFLSRRVEPEPVDVATRRWHGLGSSRGTVLKLSALFALDAFGGGFILQSLVADWFATKFDMSAARLGTIFFFANLLAAVSGLAAAALAQRFGLLNTMVFTHLPSNILLILVPLMPNLPLALAVFLSRFAISQMDVPTRQSYTMSVVAPSERSAAAGVTSVARSLGAALAPLLAGLLTADHALIGVPFFVAGGVKIVYDLWLYRLFRARSS